MNQILGPRLEPTNARQCVELNGKHDFLQLTAEFSEIFQCDDAGIFDVNTNLTGPEELKPSFRLVARDLREIKRQKELSQDTEDDDITTNNLVECSTKDEVINLFKDLQAIQ